MYFIMEILPFEEGREELNANYQEITGKVFAIERLAIRGRNILGSENQKILNSKLPKKEAAKAIQKHSMDVY